jgi:hypothetical protein
LGCGLPGDPLGAPGERRDDKERGKQAMQVYRFPSGFPIRRAYATLPNIRLVPHYGLGVFFGLSHQMGGAFLGEELMVCMTLPWRGLDSNFQFR